MQANKDPYLFSNLIISIQRPDSRPQSNSSISNLIPRYNKAMDLNLQLPSPAIHFLFIQPSRSICSAAFSSNLISIYYSPSLNWSYAVSCFQWEGVCCDVNGSVTRLQLPSTGLEGVIASSIEDLTSLRGSLIEGFFFKACQP